MAADENAPRILTYQLPDDIRIVGEVVGVMTHMAILPKRIELPKPIDRPPSSRS
jgi:hypothetical protein